MLLFFRPLNVTQTHQSRGCHGPIRLQPLRRRTQTLPRRPLSFHGPLRWPLHGYHPVSYTHLDVYKRQGYDGSSVGAHAVRGQGIRRGGRWCTTGITWRSVSYTHLDVYKRQRFGEPRARPPLPRPGDTRNRSVEWHKPFIPSRNEPAEANQKVRFGELVVPWERERQGARGRTR